MKAHELISEESKWTKGVYARDEYNKPVSVASDFGVCFCITGAVKKCYPLHEQSDILKKIRNAIDLKYPQKHEHVLHETSIVRFNDEHDYETVYNLVKELDI